MPGRQLLIYWEKGEDGQKPGYYLTLANTKAAPPSFMGDSAEAYSEFAASLRSGLEPGLKYLSSLNDFTQYAMQGYPKVYFTAANGVTVDGEVKAVEGIGGKRDSGFRIGWGCRYNRIFIIADGKLTNDTTEFSPLDGIFINSQ